MEVQSTEVRVAGSSLSSYRRDEEGHVEVEVGKRLKELREARGLSQEALAEAAGLNAKFYARLEGRGANTTVTTLRRVCTALNVPLTEVFAEPDVPLADDRRAVRDIVGAVMKSGDSDKIHRLRRLLEIVFR